MSSCSVNTVSENALALYSANQSITLSSTADCTLVAENTVMVKDTMYIKPNGYLWCEIANATNLSNIQIRSLPYFSKLCVLAKKLISITIMLYRWMKARSPVVMN